jgi:hypothetical protein
VLKAEEGRRTVLEKAAVEEGESGRERQLEEVRFRTILGCQRQSQLRPSFTAARRVS